MKTIVMYQANNGKRFEKESEALTEELDIDLRLFTNRHFGQICDANLLKTVSSALFVFLMDGGNPWKILRDLLELRKKADVIRKLKASEPPDDIPF